MSPGENHRRHAAAFTARVDGVAPGAWDAPAPVEGWLARDVVRQYEGMLPLDDVLRASGQYGPRVPVPADSDPQTLLLAFIGRRP